jgi:hypothetical protein
MKGCTMTSFVAWPVDGGQPRVAAGRSSSMPRRLRRNRLLGRWIAAWLGATAVGVANAGVRELVYADRVGELAAHQISTATLLAAVTYYIWLVDQRWPVPTTQTALAIGGNWAALTILFEFGLGHYVLGSPWPDLVANYNLADGRIWVLVPVWMVVAPAAVHRLRTIAR